MGRGFNRQGMWGAGLGAIAIASALAPGAALAQDTGGGLEEIIVTAQKREQSLQDVPIAVTAVTQEALVANRIQTVNDLGSIAPGLTVRPSAGGVQVPSFTIRGQNSYGVVPGSDKQVSIYLDGVYISSPRGSIFDLPDIARLEVLRGPQGTLFGRNATAAAISVVTRDPRGEAHVKATATVGNYGQYRLGASIDLPQVGPFSGYVSFLRNYKRGEIRNAAAGLVWDRTLSSDPNYAKVRRSPRHLGTIDADSYFAAVKFEPSDEFNLTYKFDRNDDSGTPEGVAFTGYNPAFPGLGPSAPLVAPLLNALYNNQTIYINTSRESPKVVSNGYSLRREQRVFGHSATATWQASDSITVKNIAAYRKARVFSPNSIDGISSLTFTPQALEPFATLSAVSYLAANVPGFTSLTPEQQGALIGQTAPGFIPVLSSSVGGRVILTGNSAASNSRQWSDELQVNYTSDALHVTLGALWFHGKDTIGSAEGMQTIPSLTLPAWPASGLVPLGNEGRFYNKATSLAAYVQTEYKFNDQLELVAGARITRDKKTSRFRWDSLVNGVVIPRPDLIPPTYKKTKPNYLVGLNWTPNDDTLVYGKFSTSFVSGGSVAGITFVPETAKSWEFGVKADMLDRRLRANLALFHVDYKNFQQPSATTSPEAIAFLAAAYGELGRVIAPNLGTFVQQAHDVRAKGFELELTAAPTDGLTLGASLSYTKSKFTNITPVFLAAQGGSYESFIRPKWTGSAFAAYETRPLMDNMTLLLRLDGVYRSKLTFSGNPAIQISRGVPVEQLSSPGHWKINGRLALRNIAFGGMEAELAAWGRNLTNKHYAASALYLPWGQASTYDSRRSYGLDLTIEF